MSIDPNNLNIIEVKMGKFGPSKENTKYSYNLSYYGIFGVESNQVEESNFNSLKREIDKCLINNDENMAIVYAGKLAVEYGVAGLIEYIDIYAKLLDKNSSKEEMIDQEVIKLLGFHYFCKKMLVEQKEQKAIESMELIYSEDEYQSKSYWDKKEETLLVSIKDDLEYVKKEANDIANRLATECTLNEAGFMRKI